MTTENMTDGDLLMFAAKTTGRKILGCVAAGFGLDAQITGVFFEDGEDLWEPLRDDADAFRLAVDLGIYFMIVTEQGEVSARIRNGARSSFRAEILDDDEYQATRRAIVLAAAQIGKEMP